MNFTYTRDLFRAETGVILQNILPLSPNRHLSTDPFITINQIDIVQLIFCFSWGKKRLFLPLKQLLSHDLFNT